MILILSEANDDSTTQVIDWIDFLGEKFLRINSSDEVRLNSLAVGNTNFASLEILDTIYSTQQIDAYWYRRGELNLSIEATIDNEIRSEIKRIISRHLVAEIDTLKNTLYKIFEAKRSIGSFDNSYLEKLTVLMMAKEVGLIIPDSKVVSSDLEAIDILEHQSVITKSLSDSPMMNGERDSTVYMLYTAEITSIDLKEKDDCRFPSLLQEKLNKEFEVRIFYLHGDLYSMAIFSQFDPKTKVDFRDYNDQKPNRTVPFDVPKNIANKLKKLMNKLKLNTGSIDMVVTPTGDYVFLEINPIGQFGMVSNPCNYQLEKIIAQYLIGNEKKI